MNNELEKAIRYFKNMRDDNKVVLDSGFGMKKRENNLPYKNRKKYAELAIDALEKQIAKKPEVWVNGTEHCPCCEKDVTNLYFKLCVECGQRLKEGGIDE